MLLIWLEIIFINGLFCAALNENPEPPLLKLGMHRPSLGSIKILNFEPTPEDFYRDFIRSSVPVLIRTNNPSWHTQLSSWTKPDFLETHLKEISGRAFNRPIWTEDFPGEIRLNFTDFLKRSYKEKLYWDSTFPVNNTLFQHVPLPLPLSHYKFIDWIESAVLLYANRNSTSVFHQDGAENVFFQISGKKTWLLANYSNSDKAYADLFNVQPGLSPINPEKVDLKKYPLAADIEFYNITTEPGDMLYVPEHWWHHVTSFNPPIISVNLWSEIFMFPSSQNVQDVVNYTMMAHESMNELEPPNITCLWQHISLFESDHSSWEDVYSLTKSHSKFQLYFGSDISGCFYAVSSWNGKMMWNYTIGKDTGSTPAVSADERSVFFAGENSVLYAFDAESGQLQWNETLSDIVVASLRLSADKSVLYVASIDGWIYAFNVTERKKLIWKQGILNGEIWSSPLVHSKGIILCIMTESPGEPSVIMLDSQNGNVLWKNNLGRPVFASPAVYNDNNILYVVDAEKSLNAIDLITGKTLWIFEIEGGCSSSPVISPDGNHLYVTTNSGTVLCIDLKERLILWKLPHNESLETMATSSPLLSMTSNILYAAVGNCISALNASDGNILWNFTARSEFMSSPRIDIYNTLYIGGTDSVLYALDGKTGSLLWFLKTSGPIVSSVTLPTRYLAEASFGGLM